MTISFARHQFPPAIIRHEVWLYVRFTLSYRDVEDPLAERGLDVSYETVRRWVLKFGPLFARELRHRRPRPTSRWHLDEMAVVTDKLRSCGAANSEMKLSARHEQGLPKNNLPRIRASRHGGASARYSASNRCDSATDTGKCDAN
jgi:transposase-like protein